LILTDLLACPVCRGSLATEGSALGCRPCARLFPIIAGIPDLRVEPDPWIGLDDDRRKALRVLDEAEGLDFEGHVRTYWRLTPETSPEQAERFTEHVLAAAERTSEWLSMDQDDGGGFGPDGPWLDLGCGTADLGAAAPASVSVIGVDVAMRWLVIARRRLEDAGRQAHLVCANAEALPFPDRRFSRVLSLGLVEHCKSLDAVLSEAYRVAGDGGSLRFRTTNRYSLLPEPHVGVWGVGFFPRSWADRYVRSRGGTGYAHHHPWSAGEIRRGLRGAGFQEVRVGAAPTLTEEARRSSPAVRAAVPLYERARKMPLSRDGLRQIAPVLEAEARRPGGMRRI
jgi:SAM-dependent methyltransferase